VQKESLIAGGGSKITGDWTPNRSQQSSPCYVLQ